MSHSILTSFTRGAFAQLLKEGLTQQKTSDTLGVAKSTVCNELQRIKPYDPEIAQRDADEKRGHCGRRTLLDQPLKRLIEGYLRLTWSPEMIATKFNLVTSSIYNWLDNGYLDFSLEDLPNRNIRKKRKNETRGTFKVNQSIEERPDYINNRHDFGHWEADTVLSSRCQSKACVVTFVERRTRLFWAIKTTDRTATSFNKAFNDFMKLFRGLVKSITVDHGKEFSNYKEVEEKFNIKVYFCHPYAPWERGSNEYFNRRLRYFFPKKTNFCEVSNNDIFEALELINERPLKINNNRTAIESFKVCSN